MTAQNAPLQEDRSSRADGAGHFAQLCTIVALVEQMAGDETAREPVPDEAAIAAAYARAPTVSRRRFDRLSREAAAIATSGVEALIDSDGSPNAATGLAATLRRSVERLARIVG